MRKPIRSLGVFALVMITVGSVDSIRNLPTTALFGSSLIFFFILSAILFLLPSALVSAELSSQCTETGGVYAWVKEAFGMPVGFIAIWFQWIENVIWYPTILAFVAGTVGYLFSPALANNQTFLVVVILIAFWGATIVNLCGIKSSARFSEFCSLGGLLLPMCVIIALGAAWFFSGKPLQIQFNEHSMLPHMNNAELWPALTGVILSFCGMEISTVHAGDVKNPHSSYPRAMLLSTLIILGTLLLGSLAIAIVIPQSQISLVAGLMQAFDLFFSAYGMHWILPVLAIMLVIGLMGSVSNWILGPTRGLLVAAQDGNLPALFKRENKFNAPAPLLWAQGIIVTIVALAFLLMPSVNGSYWLLTVLAAHLYMFMYILMFAAGIRSRYQNKTFATETYRIPGGKRWGMWVTCLAGIFACIATVVVGFIPPTNIAIGGVMRYELLLICGLVVLSLPPFVLYFFRKNQSSVR